MTGIKINKLTAMNVRALEEVMEPGEVTLTATTATFHVRDAGRVLSERMAPFPSQGHPRASLHAVLRKVLAASPTGEK
ncbi:hypothetical protein ABT282_07340 [Streptomyces sp. NPDC000927]|uniref:hypothetical protein n=1 Tax=Streptomyces sp. NPDC000927 TaxID=3154371 RepID=UPI00332F06BE